jgi:hypothetical protein
MKPTKPAVQISANADRRLRPRVRCAAPPQPFSACEFVAVMWQAMRVCSLAAGAASGRTGASGATRVARPSAALRFCRIRLHWPAVDDASAARYTTQRGR